MTFRIATIRDWTCHIGYLHQKKKDQIDIFGHLVVKVAFKNKKKRNRTVNMQYVLKAISIFSMINFALFQDM